MESQSTQAPGARFAPPTLPPPPSSAPVVQFGNTPDEAVSVAWAARFMRLIREDKPGVFATYLGRSATANGDGPGR